MDDYLVRVIAKEEGIIGLACITTAVANESARRHQTFPTAGATLARALTGAALLGALLKIRQRVALKIEANGPIEKVLAESDSYGRIRGYVAVPEVELDRRFGEPDVSSAVGDDGLLTVVKDLGLQELYEGIVPVQDGSITEDILHYLTRSEQVPSVLEIDAAVAHGSPQDGQIKASGGLLIQALPDQKPKILEKLALRIEELPPISRQLQDGWLPEDVLARILVDTEYDTLEKREIRFNCSCSWERTEKALMLLGAEELSSLIAEGEAVIDCHFCRQQYVFGTEALETILDKLT